ncbi:hypothetical protein L7F22_008835 [Adiantum nelumboides]|nr:hypothetical protein [Adiantum nelumboides]
MEQQHLNNAVLVNGNSKLKAENEELKKNLETNLLNRAEIEGLQEQIRLLTGKLQAKEEKLDFYQKQLSRRSQLEDLQGKFNFLQEQQSEKEHKKADDSQVDEEFNVKGKRSAVEKFCFDEEPVQQTGEEYESSDRHTLISKIAGDLEKPVKSLEILSDVVITSKNVDDKEQDEKQDDVVKEKDELLVDVQNIKEQETVAEQQQDVVMEAVGDVQAIQDVVLYEAEKKRCRLNKGLGFRSPKSSFLVPPGVPGGKGDLYLYQEAVREYSGSTQVVFRKLSESCQKLADQGVIRLDQEVFRSVCK